MCVALSLCMQWADRIRRVRLMLIIVAVLLSVASLVVSHYLVRDLKREEQVKMETWSEAMRSLGDADSDADLSLVLKVLNSNNTIPVKVINAQGAVELQRNVEDETKELPHQSLRIELSETEWLDVYYDDSLLLRRLALWPYVQLGIVAVFVMVAIYALLSSKRSEQNKVWVGLSKETAHQLGTPISSLMAWVEVLHETYPDDALIPEMGKDVQRLQLIAERFSKIGSLPELKQTNILEIVEHVTEYIKCRVSNKVTVNVDLPEGELVLPLCAPLFEWVIENLCKNAIDAMDGCGRILVTAFQEPGKVIVEIDDTGKGVAKNHFKTVFSPGFTTKKRGWGLGLSLAKRIIEEYHKGKVFLKQSSIGKGSTFRIILKKQK